MSQDYRLYQTLNLRFFQFFLDRIARLRAEAAFLKAQMTCPAYQTFLRDQKYQPSYFWNLKKIPIMTKDNYVKSYGLEARCYYGSIPSTGVVIDESSGSSGVPNNWVRSREERRDIARILQLNYQLIYGEAKTILLNCFALGPWATGMNVSMSLVDVGILKSIGPDTAKLENTLKVFGPSYKYLVCAYPPFAKMFVDSCQIDLKPFHIDLVVGGEGVSEPLRQYLLQTFKTVISSYGASDLEINIGIETPMTQKIRMLCLEDSDLCESLFGRKNPPMIFQYNPLDYLIEQSQDGQIYFTICRQDGAAPKIRYCLGDLGGSMNFGELVRKLKSQNRDVSSLASQLSHFPILYVFGRGDLSVPFYGSKVFASDIENVISQQSELVKQISSFQLQSIEDENLDKRLRIHLEKSDTSEEVSFDQNHWREVFYNALCDVNQDFKEVSRLFGPSSLEIVWHHHKEGPFASRDIRVKHQYVA